MLLLITGVTYVSTWPTTPGGDLKLYAFILISVLLVVALPIQGTPNLGLFSKLLGSEGVGLFLGTLQIANAAGRIAGPLFSGYALQDFDFLKIFIMVWGFWFVSVVALAANWKIMAAEFSEGNSLNDSLLDEEEEEEEEDSGGAVNRGFVQAQAAQAPLSFPSP